MSYEKKIKDLLNRLVSMTPNPPPFPEEMPMATHETPRSRPNPVLMFVAGAALVAAVMVPVLLLTDDDVPVGAGTTSTTMEAVTSTTVSPSSTTTASPTTTTVPGTSSTQAVLPIWSRPVFVYESPEASFTGNPALVPIWVDVTAPGVGVDSEFTAALAAMGAELPEPFQNAIPSDVEIVSLTTGEDESGAHWLADMNDAFSKGAGGLLADYTMLNQLIYTITQGSADFPEVLFTVNGEPVTEFGTEGLDLTGPVDRSSFIDELSLIFLTEPIIEVENVYVVSGMANTFEASLSVRVVDGAGATVHEVPVMATCGSGCWGEFGVGITSDLIVPGESSIQLFTYSAQDGSMTDVITIPVPVGGSWQVDLSTDTP